MHIEGNKITIEKSAEEVYTFLTNLQNFEKLMPDTIQKFVVEGDSFLFGLKGMPEIRMVVKETRPFSNVTLEAASSKLDLLLKADIVEVSEQKTEVVISFEGDFNPMMAMMIKKPLTSFIDTLTENLKEA